MTNKISAETQERLGAEAQGKKFYKVVLRNNTEKFVEQTEHLLQEVNQWGPRAVVIHSRTSFGAVKHVVTPCGEQHLVS